jgi:catechol 2,3-dioxygenase-like lactoylglutathione lyase family enzyme
LIAIQKLMQVTRMVEDVERLHALEAFYLDVFAAQTYYEARPDAEIDRDESLILIGDVSLIPVAPVDPTSTQGRIRASYAGRFMSAALKVDEVAPAAAELSRHGIEPQYHHPMYRDVFFLTDPAQTQGVRWELCRVEMPNDLRLRPGWSPAWWRDVHPLGIEGLASLVTAARDLDESVHLYRDVFGFELLARRELEDEGAHAALFQAGAKVPFALEVLEPARRGTPLAEFVERYGGGIWSVCFRVRSARAAAEHLESKGLRVCGQRSGRFSIDPRDSFGAMLSFRDRARP